IQLNRTIQTDKKGNIQIKILTPLKWLNNPKTKYPIYIDDTTYLIGSGGEAYYSLSGSEIPYSPGDSRYRSYSEAQAKKVRRDNEGSKNIWSGENTNMYVNLWYHFVIDKSLSDIDRVYVHWNGHDDADWNREKPESFLYLWNLKNDAWDKKDSSDYAKKDIDLSVTLDPEDPDFKYYLKDMGDSVELDIGFAGAMNTEEGSCFLEGTFVGVTDENGKTTRYIPIESIEPGMFVWSFDFQNHKLVPAKVTQIISNSPDEMDTDYYLVFRIGEHDEEIRVVPNHLFYCNNKEWMFAGNIEVRDVLRDIDSNDVEINDITPVTEKISTYGLRLDDPYDNYYVAGKEGGSLVLVGEKENNVVYEDYVEVVVHEIPTPPPNNPPYKPYDPSPSNNSEYISIDAALSWSGGDPDPGDVVTYDVYFGTSSSPSKVASNITTNTFDPDTMEYNTTYYWRIIAWDSHGAQTMGDIWCFRTRSGSSWINLTLFPSEDVISYNDVCFRWNQTDESPSDLNYSYRLVGYVPLWSKWSSKKGVTYFDLPDGEYVFEVRAKNAKGTIDGPEQYSFAIVKGYTYSEMLSSIRSMDRYSFECSRNLSGTVRIDLYDGSKLFGRILMFDLGRIEYTLSSSSGVSKTVLENAGVFSVKPPNWYTKKDPKISLEQTTGGWWPMLSHDLMHTGYSSSESPSTDNIIWSYSNISTSEMILCSPAAYDNKLYIVSSIWGGIGKLYVLDANAEGTGDEDKDLIGTFIFTNHLSSNIQSSPSVVDDKLYIGIPIQPTVGRIFCINISEEGITEKWTYDVGGWVYSSPAVAYDRVYIGSYDHNVYCLDTDTGELNWSYTADNIVASSPAVADGRIYITSTSGTLYCLDAMDGDLLWNNNTGIPVSFPTIFQGRVYVFSTLLEGRVYCFDAATGVQLWNQTISSSGIACAPAVAYGRIYVGSDDKNVSCLDADTGNIIWRYQTNGNVRGAIAVSNGRVYAGAITGDFHIYCLDAYTGEKIWDHYIESFDAAYPVIANGRLYVCSMNKVYAFADSSAFTDFAFRVFQIRQNPFHSSGGPGSFKLNIHLQESYVRERLVSAFNVKLQIYGRYSNIWLSYLKNKYGFMECICDPTGHTIYSPEMLFKTKLLITQSLCKAGLTIS
ncbi:MAG: hypothetical protein DRN05_06560, partial [Thermoplasmata archaeon]